MPSAGSKRLRTRGPILLLSWILHFNSHISHKMEALWISALQVSFRWYCSWGMLACNRDSQRSPVPNLRDTSYSRCPLISTKGQAALLGSIPGSVLFHLSLNHSYTATCRLQLDGRYQLVSIQHLVLLVNPSGGDPDKI